jgi:ubiquinol oxidase
MARRFFGKRYGHGAVVMETVAAVPPMVAAVCLHLSSLRTGQHQTLADIRIHALLEESQTQRAHLLAFCRILRPTQLERLMILISQGVCFSLYFVAYLVSPRFCHRLLGYMKEEDITAYSQYLELIKKGLVDNVPAPMFAIDRWKLMPAARLSDFIAAVQADEAQHRDANHALADEFARSTSAEAAPIAASAPSNPVPASSA